MFIMSDKLKCLLLHNSMILPFALHGDKEKEIKNIF